MTIDKRFKDYINSYLENNKFYLKETIQTNIYDLTCITKVYDIKKRNKSLVNAELTIIKDNTEVYKTTLVDTHNWDNYLYPIIIDNKKYLFFRKSLYGFTILDINSFQEENYFPEEVYQGEEAYIITDVIQFKDILLFDGCFWGSPYFNMIYDLKTKKLFDVFEEFKIFSEDIKILDDYIIINGEEVNSELKKSFKLQYNELKTLINRF